MAYVSTIQLPDGRTLEIKGKNILYDTVDGWAAKGAVESQEGFVYVYTDYQSIDGEFVPGIKIGTGNAYIVDLPFVDAVYAEHINNTIIHITQSERAKWNNKVSLYIDPDKLDRLVFTTD